VGKGTALAVAQSRWLVRGFSRCGFAFAPPCQRTPAAKAGPRL